MAIADRDRRRVTPSIAEDSAPYTAEDHNLEQCGLAGEVLSLSRFSRYETDVQYVQYIGVPDQA